MKQLLALATCVVAACGQDSQTALSRDAHKLARCMAALDATCVINLSSVESYQRVSPPASDFRAAQARLFTQMRRAGARYARYDVSTPHEMFRHGERTYAFVPYVSAMQFPDGHIAQYSAYLIALSSNDGQSWKFFDGAHVTTDNIRTIIPAYGGEPLPPVSGVNPL